MKTHRIVLLAAGFGLAAGTMAVAQDATTYRATLQPLNEKVTGSAAAGEITFTVSGDEIVVKETVSGVPASIEHWQHFHGFVEAGKAAACPDASADANGDGIVDVIETGPVAGETMVPFNDSPMDMDVVHGAYPVAGADGSFTYDKTISLKGLEDAFAAHFNGQSLDLDQRVLFVHGVPETAELPATVASLGDIPATTTLPIACGKIEKAN